MRKERAYQVELLAPAGDETCLHAAVSAGADAVYLGLGEFNARRNAGNFSLEDFARACDYAHLRGVSIYVTMNVEILPSELASAVELACQAYEAGADAFIVQDIGLASELRAVLPDAPLHASTQMNLHNASGIALAAALGMQRVTLARELSVTEIAELCSLAADFGIEIECFGHGALCVCYSGQCLMSSMIGGRSANRGLCAQACRLPYELVAGEERRPLDAAGEHLLSPKDLCTVDLLGDLARAGVRSLKIEGRMKSPDYVYEVVSVYRDLLDSGAPADDTQRARLAEAFSRGFTTAYLEGDRGNDIMSYGRPNNRGIFAGRVARVGDGWAEINPELAFNEGDTVEFWTNKGRFAERVDDVRPNEHGNLVVKVSQRVSKGDRVFRVRNAAASFTDDRLEPRLPVRARVLIREGRALSAHFETVASDGTVYRGQAEGPVVEKARTKALSEQDARDHIDRLGQSPFSLYELDVELDEGVGLPFSQLHHLRSDALQDLERAILEPHQALARRARVQSAEVSRGDEAGSRADQRKHSATPLLAAWTTNPGCARAARRAGAEALYVPLLNFRRGQSQLAGALASEPEQAGYPKQCIMALPTVEHDPLAPASLPGGARSFPGTREFASAFDMWDYVHPGKVVFADNLASALRALELGAQVEVGPHVPVTNAAALRFLAELGVSRVWLSPELTLGQIADLAEASPLPLGLFVSGAQELMVTEHCLLMSQGPCAETCESCERRKQPHALVDRKGFEFPVVSDMYGRSHLYNGIELDAAPFLPDFIDMGISAFMVDTTLMDKKSSEHALRRLAKALSLALSQGRSLDKRPGTTTGHLHRGVT